ncbi:hypothetical protein [Yoonia sp.]|uniref:hypothetical protein n=1 Tax=Yoonia sp. TaxID=2212373 RepID=UPI001A035BC9|nr:hypothetical protein [Yoonia sp.]MBE0413207.1 hypothetical protein [Yoonia sp.]
MRRNLTKALDVGYKSVQMMLRMFSIFLAALVLAACGAGGGDSPGSGIDPRLGRLDIYAAQKLRVLGDPGAGVMAMPVTAEMPTSGTVDFAGFATINIEAQDPLVLFGDLLVSVTFETEQIAGHMNRFFGTNSQGQVVDYAGDIAVISGAVGGAAASDVRLEYAGMLTAPDETLVFDGTAAGSFLATPIAAISLSELEAAVLHNGIMTNATLLLVGEVAQ